MTNFNKVLNGQLSILCNLIITICYPLLRPILEGNHLFRITATGIIANQLKLI
jgi:hypothetical protein